MDRRGRTYAQTHNEMNDTDNSPRIITADRLQSELLRIRYRELLAKPEVFPSEKNWQYIIGHAMEGIGHELYRKYLVSWLMPEAQRSEFHTIALREFPHYIAAVRRDYALDIVYGDTDSAPDAFASLVNGHQLFCASKIRRLLQDGNLTAVFGALGAFQPEYTISDLREMRALERQLQNMPALGRIEQRRTMFSTEERYICPNGHSNPSDEVFCRDTSCRQNIYGLTPSEDEAVKAFSAKVATLSALLSE